MEWTTPAFAFPAEAGTHLPTTEGWKAELALGGWLVTYQNKCPGPELNPYTVAHLSTNRARRRLTSLIETNKPTTKPDHQSYRVTDLEGVGRSSVQRIAVLNLLAEFVDILLTTHA